MSVDKFGRMQKDDGSKGQLSRGLQGHGYTLDDDGHFNIENKRLKSVHEPVDGQDAVTKEYVEDNFFKNQEGKISVDGKRLLNLAMRPTENSEATSKFYVDKLFEQLATIKYVDEKCDALKSVHSAELTKKIDEILKTQKSVAKPTVQKSNDRKNG